MTKFNPRGSSNVPQGLRYSSTPVGALGPNQAASINHYKNTLTPGPYVGSVPVGSLGPNQAAAIGRHMAKQRAASIRSMFGGRFDQRMGISKTRRPGNRSGKHLPTGGAGGFVLFGQRPLENQRIRRMTNKGVNAAFVNADPRNAMKQFAGRGLSQDEGTMASAIPRISQALGNAAYASMGQPLFDYLGDQAYGLQQQRNRVNNLSPLLALLR